MKIVFYLALLAETISSTVADSPVGPTRKLALSTDYKGGQCDDMLCAEDDTPVCGSEGVTYRNIYELGLADCNHPERSISLIHEGPCAP
ncbi:hypothetical protein JG687_00016029 [Phytophthora cactorum]|uniref:Kazal-like domain-containing protein n=1 Tax=Phytophthora cactorum TaxID=29920 RepID=A0A329RIR4_9STRA|nr:hypothetical protein Pcac1_g26020 [Phytophthora cactorum]KAG2800221.1 hypothetical protein PC112_g20578 [Phytophthora cactorum]KAG2819087.1 hypothetical protein PC111_g12033 [Phytophthora cactorum]KAG2854736.1 hypothetical protein PC113_g13053 [Phytophthora cactorum]KAG2898044.1 hypothetical protein PC114_g14437 [Phytophthora cactorum]